MARGLVEAQIASWDILRMPVDSKYTVGLPSEYAVREHMSYPVPS